VSQNKENEMLEQNTQSVSETDAQNPSDLPNPEWGNDAPRGGKAVLNRIIKEKATVPLFFGQTPHSRLSSTKAAMAQIFCSG
jgi:hypothetical protein